VLKGARNIPMPGSAWTTAHLLYSDYSLTLNAPRPTWDPIFPQNQGDWNSCTVSFFSHLARIAPDIHWMQNQGSLFETDGSDGNHDLALFQKIYANIGGLFREEAWLLPGSPDDSTKRHGWYKIIRDVQWLLQQGKPFYFVSHAMEVQARLSLPWWTICW
jgi:hypothetical protein